VKPYRIKLRTPSFANMSFFPEMAVDNLVADLVANLGSIDVVIPEIDR
jgi:NADH-quinone oxidoreductase subunit D